MFVLSVPLEYGASFMAGSSTANCITSTLHIRAIEQTNNSLIQCAVVTGIGLNRTYFPPTAHLLVQGITIILSLHMEANIHESSQEG